MKESEIEVKNLDWKEIGIYLRYHMNDDTLERAGYDRYCPTKRVRPGRFPLFVANGTVRDEEKRHAAWVFPVSIPEANVVREMFCEAVGCMIRKTMDLHDFCFDGRIYRQRSGGAIGMDLTGVIADVYMCKWDRQLLESMERNRMRCRMFKRYKDDSNMCVNSVRKGDKGRETMDRLIELADDIDENLSVTGDCTENYEDGKLPSLDLKMWIEEDTGGRYKLKHEHYMKSVSSRMVINANSAHGKTMKENVNVNECMRIIRNTSEGENVVEDLSYYMQRMQFSGYTERERMNVVKKTYERIEKGRQRREDDSGRRGKRDRNWYLKSGKYETLMVVDATPREVLKKTVEKVAKKHGVRVKVVERRGKTVKGMLQKSNPFGIVKCKERDCVICRKDMGIDCRKRGVVYQIECREEGCGKKYIGQTGRTIHERFKGHEQRIGRRGNNRIGMGPVEKHRQEHGGKDYEYKVEIKDSLYGKATKRMISEAVRIEGLDREECFNRKQGWTYTPMFRESRDNCNEGSFLEGLVADIEELEGGM